MNLYSRQIRPQQTPGLAGELDAARALQRAADSKVMQLEQELESAHDAMMLPDMTEHEWCVAIQRCERNVEQHKANLDYLDKRWIEHEFCSKDIAQPKGEDMLNLMKRQERLDYALAKANLYKLKMQYECAQIGGDYDQESNSLKLQAQQCNARLEISDELRSHVCRVFGI